MESGFHDKDLVMYLNRVREKIHCLETFIDNTGVDSQNKGSDS